MPSSASLPPYPWSPPAPGSSYIGFSNATTLRSSGVLPPPPPPPNAYMATPPMMHTTTTPAMMKIQMGIPPASSSAFVAAKHATLLGSLAWAYSGSFCEIDSQCSLVGVIAGAEPSATLNL